MPDSAPSLTEAVSGGQEARSPHVASCSVPAMEEENMRRLIDGTHRFQSGIFRTKKELFECLTKG